MFKFVCLFALVVTPATSTVTTLTSPSSSISATTTQPASPPLTASGGSNDIESDNLLATALRMVKDCGDSSMILCMKERALHYFDSEDGDVKLADGIKLVKTDDIPVGRSLNEIVLPHEPEARENEVNALLLERIARFFGTHTLQFKVPKDAIQDMQRALEESRGKKKKEKKYLLPLLLLFKLKMAALLPLAIGFLALISFKALVIGKIALVLSSIIGLKKLLESKKESYEVVSHPHVHEEHGYGRSLQQKHQQLHHEAQDMAYSAYQK